MSDATCKTCPWCNPLPDRSGTYPERGECRKDPPAIEQDRQYFGQAAWPLFLDMGTNWCGSHPDRQPHLEGLSTTLVTREPFPTAADMRRIVDALEKMASRAARGKL